MVRISQEILKSWDILRISQDLDIPGSSSSASLFAKSLHSRIQYRMPNDTDRIFTLFGFCPDRKVSRLVATCNR